MDEIIKNIEERFLENNLNCLHLENNNALKLHKLFLTKYFLKNTKYGYMFTGNFEKYKFLFTTINFDEVNKNHNSENVYITKINEKDQLTHEEPERKMIFKAYAEIAKDKNLQLEEMQEIKAELEELTKEIDENIEKKKRFIKIYRATNTRNKIKKDDDLTL